MRKNKHIRVQDAPTVPTTVAPTVDPTRRFFQLGDSAGSATLGTSGGSDVIAYRLEIPVDNSTGTGNLAVLINGSFMWYTDIPAGEYVNLFSYVRCYWSDLNKNTQSEWNHLNYSNPIKSTIANNPSGSIWNIYDNISFVASGLVVPGETRRLYVELIQKNVESSSSKSTDYIGPWVTGIVVDEIDLPWYESFWVQPADDDGGDEAVGDWNDDYSAGGSNYVTEFPYYNFGDY